MAMRAVFIDKDGTLVQNVPYNVDPARVSFTPGAIDALRALAYAGYELFVISNQSGVARGFFDEAAVLRVFEHIHMELASTGVVLAGSYYCPHLSNGTVQAFAIDCDCRKPAPGLLLRTAAEHDIDLASSFVVGDILDDVEAGKRAGCRTVLLDTGCETEWHLTTERTADFVAKHFGEGAAYILACQASNPLEVGARAG